MSTKIISRRDVIKASGLSLAALSIPSVSLTADELTVNSDKGKQVAFITGGARGIGLKTAETFAGDGVNIVLYDIAQQINSIKYPLSSIEDLNNARKKIEALGVKCLAIQGDVRSLTDLKNAVDKTIKEFGQLDYLIANAAVTQMGETETFDAEIITDMLEINVGGVLKTIQAAIPVFKRQKSGRIVTISSVAGRGGAYMFSIYGATKWGVIGLSKSVAQELGGYNVTCNVVCPSLVNTLMVNNDHLMRGFDQENPNIESVTNFFQSLHTLPIGILDPKEIADSVKYLCSYEARHISGIVLDIAAGFSARNIA